MSIFYKIYENKAIPPADPTLSFEGRNVVVTGSNVGLGFEAAVKFAQLGASRLILAVRNLEKGNQAKQAIEERLVGVTIESKRSIEVWELDMNSYDSIQTFAARVNTDLPTVDIALLNAGVWNAVLQKSRYGWEEVLQVNTLSTSLLALLLLPKLKASKEATGVVPTLEIVSSGTHHTVNISPEEVNMKGSLLEHFNKSEGVFDGRRQYGASKLFMMCALGALVDIVSTSDGKLPAAWCTSVCPGLCKSDLSRGLDSWGYAIAKPLIWTLIARTTEQGARALVSGCTLGEEGHGKFWQHDRIHEPTPLLAGEKGEIFKKRIWSEIIDALSQDIPDIREKSRL